MPCGKRVPLEASAFCRLHRRPRFRVRCFSICFCHRQAPVPVFPRYLIESDLLAADGFGEGVEEVEGFPVGIDGQPLVLAVGAHVVAFESDGGEAVARDADQGEVDGVAGAVLHLWRDGQPGPDLLSERGQRL